MVFIPNGPLFHAPRAAFPNPMCTVRVVSVTLCETADCPEMIRGAEMTTRRESREDERLLAQLQGTPVGRRWLLKAGLGSAAAAAVEQ